MEKTHFKFFIINIISIFFIFYSTLSIIRSIGLLYLTFSDIYFYNFDFDIKDYHEKINIYFRYYYYVPYILGTIIFLFYKKLFKINWGKYALIGLLVVLFFRLIDASFVRPLFAFFENTRINTFILLLTFLIIGIYILNKRLEVKRNIQSGNVVS